ncbi:MAG TPA: cytochrome c oxidase assembly protein [Thermoanaerobaculia bacterium]|nr:cytochrome c oxidase assembly protein [Thermoanaerobaculia bacterium]
MSHWTVDPVVLASLLVAASLYSAGVVRLRREAGRAGGVPSWQLISFAAAWVALVLALLSPVAALSDLLFSVHMTQHEILMLVAAPLLVLARPLGVFLWGFPLTWRLAIGRWTRRPAVAGAWRALTGAVTVWILHGAALWIWHLPRLYQAAVEDAGIHALMHVCFLFTAALFWWALVHGRYGRLGYGLGVFFVFTTGLHSTVLGALLTLAPRSWYPIYRARAPGMGVDPLADQQLGGLLMWVPFGIVFLVIGLALFAAWLGEAERRVAYTSAESEAVTRGGTLIATLLIALMMTLGCNRDAEFRAARWTGGGLPSRGKHAIRRFGCSSCHAIPGIPGADGLVGPSLERIASRVYIAGSVTNTPQNMMRFIAHPHGVDPQTVMPEMGIPDRDVRDIAAYLYTLR